VSLARLRAPLYTEFMSTLSDPGRHAMPMRQRILLLSTSLAILCGVTTLPVAMAREVSTPSATMTGDLHRPCAATHWQRAELYFGLGTTEGQTTDADRDRWQQFLDEEVTPRFPDGFSVIDAYGQWQRKDNRKIEHLNSKLVVILFQGAQHRRDLDALRAAWKQRTGDESVLLSITRAEVSF